MKQAKEAGHKLYQPTKKCRHGHDNGYYVANRRCVTCHTKFNAKWTYARRKLNRTNDPVVEMIRNARWRAKRKGQGFTIMPVHVKMPKVCPCCGNEFVLGAPLSRAVPQAPSLDRVDSTKGYIPGNVAVICSRCNMIKNEGTAEEHERIAQWMRQHVAGRSERVEGILLS